MPIINKMAMRLAVAYLFTTIHGAPEDENDWKGQESVGPKKKKGSSTEQEHKDLPHFPERPCL
jgi:hypothetical protein